MSLDARSRRWLEGAVLAAVLGVVPVEARAGTEGVANLYPQNPLVDDSGGNGNGLIERNECVGLAIQLYNADLTTATGISALLSSSTPGVSIVTPFATYPDIPGNGIAYNVQSFRISTDASFGATAVELSLAITADQGAPPPRPLTILTGRSFEATATIAIPDNDPQGAVLPVNVSGLTGALTKVIVSVHVLHPSTDQLDLRLEGPGGASIDLSSDNGLGANYGSSCTTVTTFDDGAPAIVSGGTSPFAGTYRPEQPLATFAGASGANLNGQWRLRVVDDTAGLTGTIQCVRIRIQTDAGGTATCRTLTIGDVSVAEGDFGTTVASFPVTMDAPSAEIVNLTYVTGDLTATSPADYTPASGGLVFQPGEVSKTVPVTVKGDLLDELDEQFRVVLIEGHGAYVVDGIGIGTIRDDDGAPSADRVGELAHGSDVYTHLAPPFPQFPDGDTYLLRQEAYSSYEVVVDAISGDVQPLSLQRLSVAGTVAQDAVPVGAGPARTLRWVHDSPVPAGQGIGIRVTSGGCGTNCGADDTYRIRAYDTTASIPRFSNANAQGTFVMLQAAGDDAVEATVLFWSPAGALLHRETHTIPARGLLVLPTQAVPVLQGASGSITVMHDARYGELVGKAVSIDPSTGFSFDSPMLPRGH